MPPKPPPPRQILPKVEAGSSASSLHKDSLPDRFEPPSKRRCISSACMPCRKRKSKCDGRQPSCTACTTVYESACHYDLDADHRRKGALKRDIAQLKEETQILGAIIDSIKKGSEADVDDIVQLIRSSNSDTTYESLALSVQKLNLNKNTDYFSEPTASLEGELVSDFSPRPSFYETSQSSHYGYTSNLSFPVDEDRSSMTADQAGAWTNVTNDVDFINHLLNLYFTWSHPLFLLFSEEVFLQGMHDGNPKCCTPLLFNTILSIGCHYSDRPEARADPDNPNTVGDHFFAEAKRLLTEDDDQPSLTIVQSLGLMSLRQAQSNHDSSGRRYIAQMMSMAIELGLHLSHAVQLGGKFTTPEIEARRVTMWGCFFLETCWAICVGRISTLPRTAIRLDKINLNHDMEQTLWRPLEMANYENSAALIQRSNKYSFLNQISSLSEIIDDILHLFYAPRDRVTSRKLQSYHEKLQQWHKKLPEEFAIQPDQPTLPHVIVLHLFYHNSIINLFRPFLKVSFVQSSKSPRHICTESANSISQLVRLYSRIYGLRMALYVSPHCIMSAAIIHLVNISGTQQSNRFQSATYLAEAIAALNEMIPMSGMIPRCLSIICKLVYTWCQVIPPVVREAMDEANLSSPASTETMSPSSSEGRGASLPRTEIIEVGVKHTLTASDIPQPVAHHSEANGGATGPSAPRYQQLFWTPFTETFEGLPLTLPQENSHLNQHMDITNVLDSGVDGDWPQWNRDGFTRSGEEDGAPQGWDFDWNASSS